ncbi:MAG: undecaprenyl-diphosphate phosphatase [Ectothiorhodospiraceae bacterium]|nr:undecaprenyl-diphosphate phosphatase [Chromatiales bacterium]MCP5157347.1 undecaprenyl-diphosphate phosphatase [Ectothiorhodospiraceae bacterium]
MALVQVVVLAVLQGLTEFLPISSSAHLILVPVVVGWPDQGIAFDVSVHVGTLVAVVAYFRRELWRMGVDFLRSLVARKTVGESRLAWLVGIATIPVGVAGLALSKLGPDSLRDPAVIAAATVVFALALWWADRAGERTRDEHSIGLGDALVVGCAQALALVPGTSRSGVTMTAALALGLTREAAARFSFLLSVPVIVLAGGLEVLDLAGSPGPVDWGVLGIGALVSGICAYLTIHFFLKLVTRVGMMPFVVYRLALGAILFLTVV